MIKAVANKKIDLTKEEYQYYLELESSFGKEAFYDLFKTDDAGHIIAITPSPSQPTAMLLIFFLLNVMHNQKLRKLDSWVDKLSGLEDRIKAIEKIVFADKK
jgi:hypothetical protein